MTRSRLILIIRLCLLSGVALWCEVPWYAVAPVALIMPVFAALTLSCVKCSGATSRLTYQVDIAGLSNGCWDMCNDANGSWIVPQDSIYDPTSFCFYSYNAGAGYSGSGCAGGGSCNGTGKSLLIGVGLDGPNSIFEPDQHYYTRVSAAGCIFRYDHGLSTPNCQTFSGLTCPFTTSPCVATCTGTGSAVVQVTSL